MKPIRILHVVTYMGRGGLETMIMNYYRHMDRSQIQFDFLVHRDFRADYDDEIEALGGRIYRLPQLIPWSRSYNEALNRFFASHPEYRIVHVHQDCLSSVVLKVAEKQGVPVRIAHSHSSSQDKNLKYLIKLFYKHRIPAFATQLFACGRDAGDWMFGGAPYRIINNAIDARKYTYSPAHRQEMRQQLGIREDAFVVGHVGRFNAVKNHTFLLDVFAQVRRKQQDAVLLLVGEGDLRCEIEKKAESLGLKDGVIFTGMRTDVPDLMQAMDCFVFPSLYEGIPVTMIEAQAAGLPCVISDAVPEESRKTDLVERIGLQQGAVVWADRILTHMGHTRPDTCAAIAAAGYDIVSNALWLQNYYLEQWKKEA